MHKITIFYDEKEIFHTENYKELLTKIDVCNSFKIKYEVFVDVDIITLDEYLKILNVSNKAFKKLNIKKYKNIKTIQDLHEFIDAYLCLNNIINK